MLHNNERGESNTNVSFGFGGLFFMFFIAIKLVGTSLAGWSWWWVFMPFVPVLSLIVKRFGL